jgi:hypothetical protein
MKNGKSKLSLVEWYVQREKKSFIGNEHEKQRLIELIKNRPDAIIQAVKENLHGDILSAMCSGELELINPVIIENVDAHAKEVLEALKKEFLGTEVVK